MEKYCKRNIGTGELVQLVGYLHYIQLTLLQSSNTPYNRPDSPGMTPECRAEKWKGMCKCLKNSYSKVSNQTHPENIFSENKTLTSKLPNYQFIIKLLIINKLV